MALKANYQGIKKVNIPLALTKEGTLFADTSVIAPSESGTSASQAYEVGDEIYLSDGQLYIVTSPIAKDATFIIKPDENYNLEPAGSITEQLGALSSNKADNTVIAPVENGTTVQNPSGYAVGSHAIRNGAFITWKNAKAQGETINDVSDYDSGDVASAIDTVTTGAANTPHTSITLDTRNLVFKNNKTVITRVQFAVTVALTGDYTTVFNLPYAPINNCYINFQLIDMDNNVVVNNRTSITSTGSVRIYGNLATGNYQIVGTYFTD